MRKVRPPRDSKPLMCQHRQAISLDILPHDRGRMAARVRVMVMLTTRTVRSRIIVAMSMVVPTAFAIGVLGVQMIQCQHTTTESGDHAEHQKPCKQAAHASLRQPNARFRKLIFPEP